MALHLDARKPHKPMEIFCFPFCELCLNKKKKSVLLTWNYMLNWPHLYHQPPSQLKQRSFWKTWAKFSKWKHSGVGQDHQFQRERAKMELCPCDEDTTAFPWCKHTAPWVIESKSYQGWLAYAKCPTRSLDLLSSVPLSVISHLWPQFKIQRDTDESKRAAVPDQERRAAHSTDTPDNALIQLI